MPTIHKSDVSFGGVKYTRIVNFSNKSKKFYVDIPKECANVMGYERIEDESLNGLEKKFLEGSEQFLNSKAKIRKVIAYKILMNCGEVQEREIRFESLGYHEDGIGIQVIAGVYNEKVFDFKDGRGKKTKNIMYESIPSSIPGFMSEEIYYWNREKYKIVDWTPEREEFFRTFGEAMSKLCRMVRDFLGDEKKLLDLIAKGARILPPPEQKQ